MHEHIHNYTDAYTHTYHADKHTRVYVHTHTDTCTDTQTHTHTDYVELRLVAWRIGRYDWSNVTMAVTWHHLLIAHSVIKHNRNISLPNNAGA